MKPPPPSHFDYHGVHAVAPHDRAFRVRWSVADGRSTLVRVREHTCMHAYPMYEVCVGGGLSFIQQYPFEDLDEMRESPWMRPQVASELWMRILTGQAW